jgi:hypothetical protein
MQGPVLNWRTWTLLLAAALLIAAAALNLRQRTHHKVPPMDGAQWTQTAQGITAHAIAPDSPAARGGLIAGDVLIGISLDNERTFQQVVSAADVQIYLEQAGVGGSLVYQIERPTNPEITRYYRADIYNLEAAAVWTRQDRLLAFIGLVWLFVGLYVLFKQGTQTPFVTHFATMALTAFVFHCYQPTGAYEDLDVAIAILDDFAFLLFAPLFLHFCALYPTRYRLLAARRWRVALFYAPAALMMGLTVALYLLPPSKSFGWLQILFRVNDPEQFVANFYRIRVAHFTVALLLGAGALAYRLAKTKAAVVRQQLKWVVLGSLLAVAPFSAFYALNYVLVAGAHSWLEDLAIAPLILIPLTFGNSVVRYRLMDVDMVVRRAAVYALTTLALAVMIGLVVYGTVIYALGNEEVGALFAAGQWGLRVVLGVLGMAAIVMVAAPIKHFLQERVDRLFYGERYDLRHSLLDFGRTLSANTALDDLLNALVSRLQQVLNVERVALFLEDAHAESGYRVARTLGLHEPPSVPNDFRDMIRTRSAETGVVRADEMELDLTSSDDTAFVRHTLHYYVPCVTHGRMVAVIGLGRSSEGSLLSSEDVEILRTVSGYIAVALENSLLYQEQKARTAEVELLKDFNESIVESVNVGLIAVDLDGRVTGCNSAVEEMLGIQRREAVGRRVEELFAADFAETLRQALGPESWHLHDLRNLYKLHTATRDGRPLILNAAVAPLRAGTGRTGALLVIEDVTSRVRLEEQLSQREKLSSIGLLAAGVAHEVNTPLTGISSYTQMLLSMVPDDDPKHALLHKMQRQNERASNIVTNLLNFSRAGSSAEFNELDVHRVLDDTMQLLDPQMRGNRVTVTRRYADKLPATYGNAGKLQQVFTNLILNARDALPDGGQITLSTAVQENGQIAITIADDGLGIAPENLAKIFDPFFTTKGVGRGTGLGLAVTYGLVQEHSGHITVESAPGQGASFCVTLPPAPARVMQQAASD